MTHDASIGMQIRVREDQEGILSSLGPREYELLADLRPFMQASGVAGAAALLLERGWVSLCSLPRAELALALPVFSCGAAPLCMCVYMYLCTYFQPMKRMLPSAPSLQCAQAAPFMVSEGAALTRGYRLFRTMGLRHLLVAPAHPMVVGLVTRKDIINGEGRGVDVLHYSF